jgi:hypothetical protein
MDVRGNLAAPASFLHMISAQEMEDLHLALARGHVPADLENKLRRLEGGELLERAVARHCRIFIALLEAAHGGLFTEVTPAQSERLLRVLAYVRKDDDARPDYQPLGFTDDQQEMLAAEVDLHAVLNRFKAWRLKHQVPGMWLN